MVLLRTLNLQRLYGSEIGSKASANLLIVIVSSASFRTEINSHIVEAGLGCGPRSAGLVTGPGRAVGNWSSALLWPLWGRGWWPQGEGMPRVTLERRDCETHEFPQDSNNTNIVSRREHWAGEPFLWLTISMTFHVDDMEPLQDHVAMNEGFSHSSVKSVKFCQIFSSFLYMWGRHREKKHMREHFSDRRKKKKEKKDKTPLNRK